MNNDKISCMNENSDIAYKLHGLLDDGWSEEQIVKLARMRAVYRQTRDMSRIPASLAFARWLYQNGKLEG
ncbi:MAG TPA: hypothetical protein VH186_37755 [Chloroflexia bacterium]|nr:hypothetical protein [Chloroflexia bacterium]